MSVDVSEQSWLGRIGGAIKGLVVGLILAIIAVPVLFWNEGRAVHTHKGLQEGAGAVVSVESDAVSPDNDGKLVFVNGMATTEDVLRDDEFGVEFNGVHLQRYAEMYQWLEKKSRDTQKKMGGGTRTETTYDYKREWDSRHVDSSKFRTPEGHQNPQQMKFEASSQQAESVRLGGFQLPSSLVSMIRNAKPLPIDQQAISEEIAEDISVTTESGKTYAYWRPNGKSDDGPQIGDVRVWFVGTAVSEISLVSKQTADTFEPYQTQTGTELNMLTVGAATPESMFAAAEATNVKITWFLRGAGTVAMFIGFVMLMRPITVLADVIPFLGSIAEVGTGLVAALLAGAGSLTTISIAWIVYRPLLGITLLMVSALLLFLLFSKARAKKQNAADEAEMRGMAPPL